VTDFGRDLSCTDSLRTARYVSGARLVAEAAYRRLITPRGALRGGEEEATYGLDLVELVGSVASPAEAASLAGRIEAELLKDDRIASVEVTVTPTTTGPATAYAVAIRATTDAGPFDLTLSVDDVTVESLGLSTGGS
jgi:hypothetical protein